MPLQIDELNRWGAPLLSIVGALGLAWACIYWDLRRRLPRRSRAKPSTFSAASAGVAHGNRTLQGGIALLASAWLMRYLSDLWGAWLVLAGQVALVAGISLLALHVARRLSAMQRGSEGE